MDKTIAILPFVNMSSSEENEYFSDGITEEIINALAKINQLKVTSRTSSFYFKGKNIPITQIGEQLNVSTILEGSVRLSGESLRITAQLIHVKEDYHFWSETWDRKRDNIFEIQDEISLLIADKLREHLGHLNITKQLVHKSTKNIKAYEHCLQAKFYENQWNPEDTKIAISYYEKALELDSNYADAYLGLANTYSFLGTTGFMPFEQAWGKTIQYTQQAHALDPKSSGVHYQLSNQAFFIECDYNKSLQEMKLALSLNSNNAEAQQFISFLYILAGEREKSKHHLDIALEINPLSEETHFFRGYYQYMIENNQQALSTINECLIKNNKNIPAHAIKTLCLLKLGRYDEVIDYFNDIPSDVIIEGEKTGSIALAHALKKDEVNTASYLLKLKKQRNTPNGFTADSYLFLMYAVMGKFDTAFQWVKDAIKQKSSLVLLRYSDPLVGALKKDSRYRELKDILYKVTSDITNSLPKKDPLDKLAIANCTKRLMHHIENSKPYLNPELTLRSLAAQIEIHPNQLSWLLNKKIGRNFNTFINQYRIAAFKEIAKNSAHSNLTIEGLAYESGFNSKTVFNTYFKKETGLTPKQFINQLA